MQENPPATTETKPLTPAQQKVLDERQSALDAMYAAGDKKPFHAVVSPAAPPVPDAAGVAVADPAPGLREHSGPFSHLGAFAQRAVKLFVDSHQEEVAAIEEGERRRHQVRRQFAWFNERIAAMRGSVEGLRAEVANFAGTDFPRTIVAHVFSKGTGILGLLSGPDGGRVVFAAFLAKQYGAAAVELAEAELGELVKQQTVFLKENKTLLKEFGLV